MNHNKVEVKGNIVRDPYIGTDKNGNEFARISLAINNKEYETTYLNDIAIFGKSYETIKEDLKKGAFIALTGALKSNSYTDTDGTRKSDLQVIAFEITPLKKKEQEQTQEKAKKKTKTR